MDWLRQRVTKLALPLIFIIGLGLLTYPSISDYWNSFHQSQAIMSYAKSVAKMSSKEYDKILDSARQYNAQHSINWNFSSSDRAAYEKELNFNHDGSMGYIVISKINVKLTIFHGTDESVLQTSIGHLEGTSLPIGGKGTHCVLSGHRGLPSARLFSDLDKLREGDTFTLHVLNETMTYEVDQIRVVDPTDLSSLTIDPEQDYVTLVTCTPYGINTHRLLVRGHRVANADGDANVISEAFQIRPIYIAPFIAVPICLILIGYVLIVTSQSYQDKHYNIAKRYLSEKGLLSPSIKESKVTK
ncbi:class C sortase [Streptococcus sciuri]|uniref:Class C sortase n=1 Tax=Streptococcus sciuri TaxID=2973939 RepID=A0ABT2F8X5_9STRE|nr:class C sortase [Streptococcus sciuri]MCS4488889.1 class C sortase [Streptococcus sciuri]